MWLHLSFFINDNDDDDDDEGDGDDHDDDDEWRLLCSTILLTSSEYMLSPMRFSTSSGILQPPPYGDPRTVSFLYAANNKGVNQ